jgi:hypothetical protein
VGVLEKLCKNLLAQGIGASFEMAKAGILETLNPFGRTKSLGRLTFQGRQINEIDAEGIHESHSQSGPAGTSNVLRLASHIIRPKATVGLTHFRFGNSPAYP